MKSLLSCKTLILSALFAFLLVGNACKENSEDDPDNTVNKPFETQSYSLPGDEISYYDNLGNRLYDRLYFLGWSKDGKAAYIIEPADEATGYYYFTFIIYDTRENKRIFEWKIDEQDAVYESDLQTVWNNNKATFEEAMNNAEIYPQEANIQKFPLIYKKQNFSLKPEIEWRQHEFLPMEVVSKAEIELERNKQKETIFSKAYDSDLKLNIRATACIISPYTDDAMLLVAEEQQGYEGPPHLIRIETRGFSFSD